MRVCVLCGGSKIKDYDLTCPHVMAEEGSDVKKTDSDDGKKKGRVTITGLPGSFDWPVSP